jgi:PAS domain S-box-containing protein
MKFPVTLFWGIFIALLGSKFSIKPEILSNSSGVLLAGFFVPLGFHLFSELNRVTSIQFSHIFLLTGFSIGIISFACGWFRKRMILNDARLTREAVIETSDDGWVVVDVNQRIVDNNPAAERFLGVSKKVMYGQPISNFLVEWPSIIKTPEAIKELEMRRSIKEQNEWHYVSMRISKLTDQRQDALGYLISWRDITQRKLAENARQKAREELFVILNGISSAASHAMSLDEFLLESINQIIYTFQSQAIGIFLVDQDAEVQDEQTLTLTAHLGLSEYNIEGMRNLPISIDIWNRIVTTNQYVLIEDLQNNPLLHPKMQKLDYSCLLILPLSFRFEETLHFLGCLFLAKKGKQNFAQDEIIRLSIISEQIGMLIDNNRRRQFSIELSERHRLQIDLHDSVSQKLYGLVTMTEAAQAALEAGSKIDPSQLLVKIGDNARQAVKEMRLFLYEMQPVDLEKEGLISVLNHRLAAVEGRADIKARLLADENIPLSKDKEIALYYIAQEALNNILKHAHAKTVSMILKKTRKKIILEILDDGIGFDLKKADSGGLGLKNMRERVSKIGGILKIASKPGKGTKISVHI